MCPLRPDPFGNAMACGATSMKGSACLRYFNSRPLLSDTVVNFGRLTKRVSPGILLWFFSGGVSVLLAASQEARVATAGATLANENERVPIGSLACWFRTNLPRGVLLLF
jgi:hypothetical protein